MKENETFYHHHHHLHHHISVTELGHLLTRSGLTYPKVSSKVYHDSFCQLDSSVSLPWVIYFEALYLHVVSSFLVYSDVCCLQLFLVLSSYHHHHISVMQFGHLLTRSGLTYPEVSSKVCHNSFCQLDTSVSLPWVIYFEAFYLHVVSSFSCIPVICPKISVIFNF